MDASTLPDHTDIANTTPVTETSGSIFLGSTLTAALTCRDVSCRVTNTYSNITEQATALYKMNGRDASWILTSSVIIFTMQTGFGLLESGCVSPKNEVNIMVKNALDVVFGGITYWAFGFGLSFGKDPGTNSFVGVGCFFVDSDSDSMGFIFSLFLFQLSFATTATTIVSGAMAERTKLSAYIIFSMINTFVYSIPAHWVWSEEGFLFKMGATDVAGCGPVHLVGGITGLVATMTLRPRSGVFESGNKPQLPSPLKTILGMFMLWWGWLRFNSGSVFIVSSDSQWKLAVRAAVNTIASSMGGGICSVVISLVHNRIVKSGTKYDVSTMVNGVLGSLVSVTAICTLAKPWEAVVIGVVGAIVSSLSELLLFKAKVDDPVGVVPVHAVCGMWGLISVGLFIEEHQSSFPGEAGLFKNGHFYLLGVQVLTIVTITVWTIICSYICLKLIDVTLGLRLAAEEELLGADIVEHGVSHSSYSGAHVMRAAATVDEFVSNGVQENGCIEFQTNLKRIFSEFTHSCLRNDMVLTLKHTDEPHVLILEMKYQARTESIDSGLEAYM